MSHIINLLYKNDIDYEGMTVSYEEQKEAAWREYDTIETKFYGLLSEEAKKMTLDLCTKQRNYFSFEVKESFLRGFKLGAQLITEIHT